MYRVRFWLLCWYLDSANLCRWKYGLLQVQAILVELLKSFEFLDSGVELFNGIAGISLMPIVKGREQEGVQVPVIVRALSL